LVMISTAALLPWSSISPRQSSGASKYAWNVRRGTRARAHTRPTAAPANPCSAATSTNASMIFACFGSSTRRRGAADPSFPAGPVCPGLSAHPSAAGPVGAELCARRPAAGRPSAAGVSPLEDSSVSRLSRPCFRFPPAVAPPRLAAGWPSERRCAPRVNEVPPGEDLTRSVLRTGGTSSPGASRSRTPGRSALSARHGFPHAVRYIRAGSNILPIWI
jgi:hypothetical protein